MEYLNAGATILSGSFSTLLTAGASTKLLIKTLHITNVTSSDANVGIHWLDATAQATYSLGKDIVVPLASSFQALDGTFVLDNNDKLELTTSVSGSIHATVSYMEITNSEG